MVALLILSGSSMAQSYSPYWTFDYHSFGDQAALYASVKIDGEPVTSDFDNWDALEIAAFVGDECRGSGFFLTDDYVIEYGDPYPTIDAGPIYYTTWGEEVSFRMYNHKTGTEYIYDHAEHEGNAKDILTGEEHWEGLDDTEKPLFLCFKSQSDPDIYVVTMKEGTTDAGNWTATTNGEDWEKIQPYIGAEKGMTLTLKYGGGLKVKSVTARKIYDSEE